MRTLVDLFVETGDPKYLEPIPAFLDWLKRSQLEPGRWARLYELESNKPLYGDRDGLIHYTLAEISAERQRGYSWQGSYGVSAAVEYYDAVRKQGRDAFPPKMPDKANPRSPSASRVARVLSQQDAQGRWLNNGWVDMRTFGNNMRLLAAALEAGSATQRQ
jgi:hypothetical protein